MQQEGNGEPTLLCSGSIISDYHVLTAAHCKPEVDDNLKGDLSKLILVMGAKDPTNRKQFNIAVSIMNSSSNISRISTVVYQLHSDFEQNK